MRGREVVSKSAYGVGEFLPVRYSAGRRLTPRCKGGVPATRLGFLLQSPRISRRDREMPSARRVQQSTNRHWWQSRHRARSRQALFDGVDQQPGKLSPELLVELAHAGRTGHVDL